MDLEERKRYSAWVEMNPVIPAGKTHINVWKEKTKGGLGEWL